MSGAGIAWAVGGTADIAFAIGAGTLILNRLVDRLRVVPVQQPVRSAPVPAEPAPKAVAPLPAGEAAQRRGDFARLRTEEGKSVAEARLAVGIAERTARRYEAERLGKPGAA